VCRPDPGRRVSVAAARPCRIGKIASVEMTGGDGAPDWRIRRCGLPVRSVMMLGTRRGGVRVEMEPVNAH
jgi:hypothetical protein